MCLDVRFTLRNAGWRSQWESRTRFVTIPSLLRRRRRRPLVPSSKVWNISSLPAGICPENSSDGCPPDTHTETGHGGAMELDRSFHVAVQQDLSGRIEIQKELVKANEDVWTQHRLKNVECIFGMARHSVELPVRVWILISSWQPLWEFEE